MRSDMIRYGSAATFVLAFGVACPHNAQETTIAPQPRPSSEDLEWTMQEHFDDVAAIRDAVVFGELATVAERAEVLAADVDPKAYPMTWRPHVLRLQAENDRLRSAATITVAAASAARLAASCGGCHATTAAKPDFGAAMEPSNEDTLTARMERHRWAVERMWEGIVGLVFHLG